MPGPRGKEEDLDEGIKSRRKEVRNVVEHVLFPAFRAKLVATKGLMKNGVVEIANLKGLYRVFERFSGCIPCRFCRYKHGILVRGARWWEGTAFVLVGIGNVSWDVGTYVSVSHLHPNPRVLVC